MAIDASILDLLASCLEYPDPDAAARARAAASGLASAEPELSAALFGLAVFLERSEPGEAEERYTALFDLQPVCTLHAGYQVFGDTYQRGELLAGLAAELKQADVACGGELPDFLPSLLRLSARIENDDRRTLAEALLLPALVRIDEALKQSPAPWCSILRALPPVVLEHSGADASALAALPPKPCALEAAAHA